MKKRNRRKWLAACMRGGALAGIVGLGGMLGSREEKFSCTGRCGRCAQLEKGKCSLGLK